MPPKSLATLVVYNSRGRKVATLLDDEPWGIEPFMWDGRDDHGILLSVGVYIVHLTATGTSISEATGTVVIAGSMR
jgi:flagellar hook assembly protein FlgD